jgi:hypothetical protein
MIRTDFGDTRESAREIRAEKVGGLTGTSVQTDLQVLDAGKINATGTARYPAQAASINILTTDVEVGIDTSVAPTTVVLPSAAAWAAAQPNGLELCIFDRNGHAFSNNITPSLNGADVFVEGVTPKITQVFGILKLRPVGSPSVNAWKVRGLN